MFVKFIFLLIFLFASIVAMNAQTTTIGAKLGIVNGKATSLPKPVYSQEAKDFCASGVVSIEVEIDENGDVSSAKAISGDELLYESAVEAAKKAKFSQTTNGYVPVKIKGAIVYNFQPEKKCVEAGIVNKKALSIPKPDLNPDIEIKQETIVKVRVVIDENGNVILAKSLANIHPLLRNFFENAARQAKFQPTNEVGKIFIKGYILYKIKLNREVETDFSAETIIGKAINLPKPPFPSGFGGKLGNNTTVLVEAQINENGNVISAKAISGHPVLRAACVAAARASKFSQTTISGVSVKAKTLITYEYILADEITVNVIVNSIEAENK